MDLLRQAEGSRKAAVDRRRVDAADRGEVVDAVDNNRSYPPQI